MIPMNPPRNEPELPKADEAKAEDHETGAYAALLRASEAARRLAQQTHTQWVTVTPSRVAQLFGVERQS